MADFGKSNAPTEQKKPETMAMLRLGTNGHIQMVKAKPETATVIGASSNPWRASSYFNKVFNSIQKLVPPHEACDCFYCSDRGLHHVDMEVATSRTYQFSFACICNTTDQIASIADLIRHNLFQLECQFYSTCQLDAKTQKCQKFSCRRFPS